MTADDLGPFTLGNPFPFHTPMLLSLPVELLERILYECFNTDRKALRSTCVLLCRLATPLVFETMVVDVYHSPAKSPDRLRAIVLGEGFAQYVRHLYLFTLKFPKGNPTGQFDRILFNKRRARKARKLEKRIVTAVSFMTSLQTVKYLGYDETFLQHVTFWDQISHLPYMSALSIYGSYRQSTSIKLSFPHLCKISITGFSYFKFASVLISNSPNLSSLGIYDHSPSSTSSPSTSSIFSQYPKGTFSSIVDLSLCGNLSVYRSDVPILIPHLSQLRSLELSVGFVAAEFWASLQAERIFVRRLSLSLSKYEPALFGYLCSYSGLHSLFLRIRTGFGKEGRKGMERVQKIQGEILTCEPPGLQFAPHNIENYHR
ncbi:hypothetical protein ARMSODRAFT_961818 [Armillaria solidipes]|uniref:F-box domain-containing protein n=1 Tax=Armillaria solidipes TaxID=1076256 RepID=A0A2H3BLA5_9AGAR|nr:hypothetical protein ARMSODRAFT_961818 [Armillaria solidipes]